MFEETLTAAILHHRIMCEMSISELFFPNCFCMFCEFRTYLSWIILKMRIITSGGLAGVFHGPLPPSLLELQLSELQRSSVASQGGMLSFLGVAKRWLPGCSATVQFLHFCTCFHDNWHLKGRLWLLTVCPWPALCLHLKTVQFNLWFHYFHWSSL